MSLEQTLSIIKPDAVAKNVIGKICSRFEKSGLRIVAVKMVQLDKEKARDFYDVHNKKPFFSQLIDFMSSGPVLVQVLEGEDAIRKNRELMGATFPRDAEPGTIRADFCDVDGDPGENAIHGSDSIESARSEILFFFSTDEICKRSR